MQYNIDLSKARLSLAKERLMYADKILEIGDYKTVANRSYYAVFSAMRAVLALDNFDSKSIQVLYPNFEENILRQKFFRLNYPIQSPSWNMSDKTVIMMTFTLYPSKKSHSSLT